jgi:glycosyltransferase involved in cell wall biosynthesis
LDIDDWETGIGKDFYDPLVWQKKIRYFLLSIFDLRSNFYNRILNTLIRYADAISVSGGVLKSMYGGTIIWHARDIEIFNPERFNKDHLKRKYLHGIPDNPFIITFVGSPRRHKGLEDLLDAIELLNEKALLLIIVGIEDDIYGKILKKKVEPLTIKHNVIFFPKQSFEKITEFLAFTDLVVIPQRKKAASYAQVPAKIFDAMAMEKPIIATDISDLPDILSGCGWIIEPENPLQLADAIHYVFNHPVTARKAGKKAREKFKEKYSCSAMESAVTNIFKAFESN